MTPRACTQPPGTAAPQSAVGNGRVGRTRFDHEIHQGRLCALACTHLNSTPTAHFSPLFGRLQKGARSPCRVFNEVITALRAKHLRSKTEACRSLFRTAVQVVSGGFHYLTVQRLTSANGCHACAGMTFVCFKSRKIPGRCAHKATCGHPAARDGGASKRCRERARWVRLRILGGC